MRTPRFLALFLALFFLSAPAPAGESWRAKPPSQWDKKDVRGLLENSPWSHRLKIIVTSWEEEDGPVPTPAELATTSKSTDPPPPVLPHGRPAPSPEDQPGLNRSLSAEVAAPRTFGIAGVSVVRWASARIVREAMARDWVLRGTMTERRATRFSDLHLGKIFIVYVDLRILVSDAQKVPINGILTQAIAEKSFLLLRRTGEHIPALGITNAPLPEYDARKELALAAYYVIFPREKNGKPVIPDTESQVRFECPLAPVAIHADFNLNKMTVDGSPDL